MIKMTDKVLITGCGGMLGEGVYQRFKERCKVFATDRDVNEPWLEYLDVSSKDQVDEYLQKVIPDYIIHLAAFTDMEYCEKNPEETYATNEGGVKNFLPYVRSKNIPFVYISTAGIFDGKKDAYHEEDVPNPLSVYGKSKYAGELAARSAPSSIVIRAGWMMGGGPIKDKKFINKIIKQLQKGVKELSVVDDKLGTPCYTYDLARIIEHLLDKRSFGIYHGACSGAGSRLDIARFMISKLATLIFSRTTTMPHGLGPKNCSIQRYLTSYATGRFAWKNISTNSTGRSDHNTVLMKSIAIILPDNSMDYLANTILDGFRAIENSGEYEIRITSRFIAFSDYSDWKLDDAAFIEYAKKSDLIIFIHAKYTTKTLVEKIGMWDKTICVDGNEVGKNNRYDPAIRKGLADGTYQGLGAIQFDLLKKCRCYFRREKPYVNGIIPFPFGIERSFVKYTHGKNKDIDFTCIFGQDEWPPLRRHATELLEKFCAKNGFSCRTSKTTSLLSRNVRDVKVQDKFREILARSKVGISIGGGGYDTLRFWETLANNCVLLTETIDIYEPGSDALKFKRIFEFKDLSEFERQLEALGSIIKTGHIDDYLGIDEYNAILKKHSSEERVRSLIEASNL
ncbi:MAG: NAD(P)-dependent oxidoreductase [Candidatus Taylorbacteria bacterium]|nr:NAD(P)-dependent oxidoreductase [Candidatus Taylorbacteria bacterium]